MGERRDPAAEVLRRGFRTMVRRGLRGVWLRGDLPAGPFVWAANHHSWWDPFVAEVVLSGAGRRSCLIMLEENLRRFGFARRLGVFGTDEPRRGLDFLADGRVLVIYPEGGLRPAGPLGAIADGAAWYARRAAVPLCAVATRVLLRGQEAPEAYLSTAAVAADGPIRDVTRRLSEALNRLMSEMDTLAGAGDPRAPLPGYRLVLRGRRSHDERIEAMAGWRPWRS
jgi:1-acyl-sn-glycerol-3-phosphate acyltransferase